MKIVYILKKGFQYFPPCLAQLLYLDDMGIKSEVTYYTDCENKSAGNSVYKNAAFVNPKAFEWLTQDQVEELISDSNANEGEQTKKSNKVIIAALIAAISLLN